MYEPKQVVSTESEIREVLGNVLYSQDTKVIDHIDEHCRLWIERSTFVVLSTVDKAGRVDVAPRVILLDRGRSWTSTPSPFRIAWETTEQTRSPTSSRTRESDSCSWYRPVEKLSG